MTCFLHERVAAVGLGVISLGGASLALAIGGAAFGPAIIDGEACDPSAAEFVRRWLSERMLPPHCRLFP